DKLGYLLREFGPLRRSYHPEYPFWRLQNDGIWEVTDVERLATRRGNTDAKKSELLKFDVKGAFRPDVYEALRQRPALIDKLIQRYSRATFRKPSTKKSSTPSGFALAWRGGRSAILPFARKSYAHMNSNARS